MKFWGITVVQATKSDIHCDTFRVVSTPKFVVSPKVGEILTLRTLGVMAANRWVVVIQPSDDEDEPS